MSEYGEIDSFDIDWHGTAVNIATEAIQNADVGLLGLDESASWIYEHLAGAVVDALEKARFLTTPGASSADKGIRVEEVSSDFARCIPHATAAAATGDSDE